MTERQKFYFVSELECPEFVGVHRNVGEDVPPNFIFAQDIEQFIKPLLNFKPDPRRQYWAWDRTNVRLKYLGEYADYEDAQVSVYNHHDLDAGHCVVLNAYRAMHLLHTDNNA